MTPRGDDLVTWLRAQLDDDEQLAQHVLSLESDRYEWEYHWARHGRYKGRVTRQTFEPGVPTPRRVLAEVEAKRRILDEHEPDRNDECARCRERGLERNQTWPCLTVRLLVQPYADRPGYREEWQVRPGEHGA